MSYLVLPKGVPPFSKAIISFWFRLPQESITKAAAAAGDILPRSIPLLTFGKQQQNNGRGPVAGDIVAGGAVMIDTIRFDQTAEPWDLDPCHVSIDCSGPDPVLSFGIRMGDHAEGVNFWTTGATGTSIPYAGMSDEEKAYYQNLVNTRGSGWLEDIEPGDPFPVGYFVNIPATVDLTGEAIATEPEYFYVKTLPKVAAEHWHHLLLSFDVGGPVVTRAPPVDVSLLPQPTEWDNVAEGVESHAVLYYALDDVDYRGRSESGSHHLRPYSVDYDISGHSGEQGDPNGILTEKAFTVATARSGDEYNLIVAPDSYSYHPDPIPSGDAEFGVPADSRFTSNIYKAEMAELQIWLDRATADTKDEAVRRLFVDRDGKPVPPGRKFDANGRELDSAEKRWGRPHILLHGTSRWKKGNNTGSLGIGLVGGKPAVIPAGQFAPKGVIDAYKPDPSLHGPQKPDEKP